MSGRTPFRGDDAHLLLVEDNDDDAFLFQKNIERGLEYAFVEELSVTRAASLWEAIEACTQHNFDAAFLDLGLPESNGVETVERFVSKESTVPIIVLTGLHDKRIALDAIRAGAQDYLVKGESTSEMMIRAMRNGIERKQKEEQLRRQRNQIEFFNNILRHDMRNALNLILGHGETLRDDLAGEQREQMDAILDWASNINDLTEKTKRILETVTDDGASKLEAIAVNDLLERERSEVETIRSGVSVSIDCPSDTRVLADKLFSDVLRNLLTNAIEHTKPDPVHIDVTVTDNEGTVRIEIADDGPGIPEVDKERIFRSGEKGDSSGGTGFGLYFVASMVETYGGDIWVEDASPSGAKFVVSLPGA